MPASRRAKKTPYRAHIIFDDSIHPHWSLESSAAIVADERFNVSLKGDTAACEHSLRAVLPPAGHVRLKAAVPLRDHQAMSLQFWARTRSAHVAVERCDELGQFLRAGWTCDASVCVSMRRSSAPEA